MTVTKQWKIRRRIAVSAYVFGIVLFPLAYVLFPKLEGIIIPYYSLITFVLTSYYGFATYQDIKNNE